MISIITPRNRHLYARELDAMFELRHRVVIREWGWRIPGATDGRESDAFDGDDTVYIVAFGADHRKVVGCARLNPTTGPHLFSELFADYCGLQGVRRGERIFELSRFLVDPSLSRRDYGRVMGSMEFAVNTFCLASHITHLTWLSHGAIYQHSLSIWDTRPLGAPAYSQEDDETFIAAISSMTEAGLQRVRKKYRFDKAEPILTLRHDWRQAPALFGARGADNTVVRPAA